MKTNHFVLLATAALILTGTKPIQGQSINVPNADFGLPVVTLEDIAIPEMISWEPVETQAQAEYGEIGVFLNSPYYEAEGLYIFNCDGPQAAYIFADYGLAIFQDYCSVDSTGGPPTHDFNATFEVGQSYKLLAGIIGNTNFDEEPGVILQMSVYYRDGSGNMVTVASNNVVYDTNVFTNVTEFVTCAVDVLPVQAGDPWAGQHIGIQFLSIIPDNVSAQGYWDLGNVQLLNTPSMINPSWSNGQFGATLLSEPGQVFKILATTDLSVPLASWTTMVTVTNVSGVTPFTDPTASYNGRFYQAKLVPPPRD